MFVEHLKTHIFYYEVNFAHTPFCFLWNIFTFFNTLLWNSEFSLFISIYIANLQEIVSTIMVFFCELLVEEISCANVNNFTTILVIFHFFCCFPIFSIIFTRSFSIFLFSSFFLWLLSFSQQIITNPQQIFQLLFCVVAFSIQCWIWSATNLHMFSCQ